MSTTIDEATTTSPDDGGRRFGLSAVGLAGLASMGAGAIHAAAVGIHAEHPNLSRIFVAVAVAQLVTGLGVLVRPSRGVLGLTILVNGAAVAGWAMTRVSGISWIRGLEVAEDPQFADTACAGLGALALVAAGGALLAGRTRRPVQRLGLPAVAIGGLTVAAMMYGAGHVHSDHGGTPEAAAAHDHAAAGEVAAPLVADPVSAAPESPATTEHGHDHVATTVAEPTEPTATTDTTDITDTTDVAPSAWPRPYDPSEPIDLSGVPGVTPEQEARATALLRATQQDLPQFADVTTLAAKGYRSIGDASTGFEHYINYGYIADDFFLDPNHPESLVYEVDGDQRTLVSAMFIATETPIDDPALVDYGGPLMQWHVHTNLCSAGSDDGPKVVGVVDAQGNCPPGSVNAGGENPMVHVWIAPHECGPFAALEGHGAGQTDPATGERTDQCGHDHAVADPAADDDGAHDDHEAAAPQPYDPTKPIDLSGTAGVTLEQQAFAENLVARTVVDLPQWADPAVAEAAGFRSIGDGATGHEHYIQWDWIEDDVWLDPDFPESLVYEPQPDGTRKLVSAMYMLPTMMPLEQVPDWGGALMQWHVHDNLCFTDDPVAPLVRGVTNPDGTCTPPLVKLAQSPMIHVWITTNECGPFAALEGLGAGTPPAGEETLCDTAHGGH